MTQQPEKNNRLALMILTLFVVVIGFALLMMPQAEGEDNAVIKGYVTEKGSGGSIENISVGIWDGEGGNGTITGDAGYYEMYAVPGHYTFYVMPEGYSRFITEIDISENETKWINVTLKVMNSIIKGYVTEDDSRGPIENASVRASGPEGENESTTDAMGYYEFRIFEGDFHLSAGKDGYYHYDDDISVGFEETIWINITLKEAPPENSIIKGYVNDADQRGPIQGASVDVDMEDYHKHNETDGVGFYELRVPQGYFDFSVYKEGYRQYHQEVDVGENETIWINVTLEEKPPETSVVKGYIYGEESRGPLEAWVGIWNQEEDYGNQTGTDQDGYYEIRASPATYIFYTGAEGYAQYMEEITIGDNETIWINKTLMAEKATVKGYIMDDSRGPIENVNINLDNQPDQMHYDVQTDDQGYFERTLKSGDWHIDIGGWGYYSYSEDFSIADDETKWFNITLESATMVHVEGHVKENGTNNPIADEWFSFWGDRYYESAVTDDEGYYEMWVASDLLYEVNLGVDGYLRYEEEVYVSGDMTYDIILEPIPPTDMTVKGYVNGYETRGPIEAMVGAMNMALDADTGTMSDDGTGYFEFEAWSGNGIIMSMAQGYYMFFKAINFTTGEMWYNITLYPELDDDSTLDGTITDAQGDPVEGAAVLLVNYMTGVPFGDDDGGDGPGFPHSTETDNEGYYEMEVPDGDWYLVVDDDGESGIVQEVTINGDLTHDLTLPEAIFENEMSVEFIDWDNIDFINQGSFAFDSSTYLTRIQIDFMVGNRDGTVNESEADAFEEFMEAMSDSDDGFDDENTTDEFSVDGIIYNFLLDSVEYGLSNMEGDITSLDPVHMEMNGKIESREQIPEGDQHVMLLNTSYEEEADDGPENLTIVIPQGFILENYEATENVSVEGLGTDTIRVSFVGEPVNDTWEWITLTAMVINILPIVDAGGDQVVTVNDEVFFEANASDADGVITLYEWDFVDDRSFSADYTSNTNTANFTYSSTGNYTVTVRVTDDRGGTKEDSLVVTVKPLVVPLPNLQIESLDLSNLEPEDGDVVDVTVTLKNTGDASATNIKVKIYVDGNLKDVLDVGEVDPNASVTVSYNWTAKDGKHTILINMTYSAGGDEMSRTIKVEGEGDGLIPGFELMITTIVILGVALLIQRKRKL